MFFQDQNLNLLVEDGSTDEVSNMLCEFFVICSTKTEPEIIEKLKCLPRLKSYDEKNHSLKENTMKCVLSTVLILILQV